MEDYDSNKPEEQGSTAEDFVKSMEEKETAWTSIDLYYKGFHIKKSLPEDITLEGITGIIEEAIRLNFDPSWNSETNAKQDPIAKATEGQGKKYTCNVCGADAEFKEGVSKTSGKPWKAVFCKEVKEHVTWGAQK